MFRAAHTAQNKTSASLSTAALLRPRLAGTNINEQSFLATDYLNHFSELVLLLNLIPERPDCLDDARAWTPKTYEEYFAEGQFTYSTLAMKAYAIAPSEFKIPFETTVERLNSQIPEYLDRIETAVKSGNRELVTHESANASQTLQRLMDVVSALANGERPSMDDNAIDDLLEL